MATRSRRSRRRRSRWSLVRRHLIEHRFNTAQGLLGLVALTAGLWLLWPTPDAPRDLRERWRQSLQGAGESEEGDRTRTAESLIAVAQASVAVSAKEHVNGASPRMNPVFERPRLAKVATTMPDIGMPDLPADKLAAVIPDLARVEPRLVTAPPMVGLPAATLVDRAERGPAATEDAGPGPSRPPYEMATLPGARRAPGGGTPTWLRNAVATSLADDRPAIAVVIDDLGLNRVNTAALNRLPGPLSLAFLPYAGALEQQTRAAHAAGHELMLHIPMQPKGEEWPGPNALLDSLAPDELIGRLRRQLRSFRGFVGINNHMGSLLTADRGPMGLIMSELHQRELLFIDSRTTSVTVAASEAARHGVPHASRDVFLDNEQTLDYVRRQMAQAERVARSRGVAIAMGHPHDVTIEALRAWLPTLEGKGFALVPVSTVVLRRACTDGLAPGDACGHVVAAQVTK